MATSGSQVLVLWDVDHTLIESGGVSTANYALAFELLTGSRPRTPARTDGRTDVDIMAGLFSDNEVEAPDDRELILSALADAGRRNSSDLLARGYALPGAAECLEGLANRSEIINSVLTGNIEENVRIKLGVFRLDKWIVFSAGAFGVEHAVRS